MNFNTIIISFTLFADSHQYNSVISIANKDIKILPMAKITPFSTKLAKKFYNIEIL